MEIHIKSPKSDIFHAIAHGKVRQISTIVSHLDAVRSRASDGKTPLIYAICEAREDIRTHVVRLLLRHGSDVNAQDENGRTALMYACMSHERLDIVRIIARHKMCHPNIQDRNGYTAVMHAVLSANASAIRVLINSSSTKGIVDMEQKNGQGLSALELAVKLQLPECCKVLIAEGGASSKLCKNQVGLLRLLENEGFLARSNTPHSRSAFANNFRNRFNESPIPENKQFEGSYMSRDTTPVYEDRYDALGVNSQRTTPQQMSRSNSLYRTNSNLFRKSNGSRPSSLQMNTPQGSVLGLLHAQNDVKRALTPISRMSPTSRVSPVSRLSPVTRLSPITRLSPVARLTPRQQFSPDSIPEDQTLGRTRLPSIPNGNKRYLVAQKVYNFPQRES